MNRTQKKCLIASVATHGLLLTLLLVGPAFFTPADKPQSHQFITMIPIGAVITDNPTSIPGSSAAQASPPPPAPPPQPQQAQPLPIPPPPQPQQRVVLPRQQPVPRPEPASQPKIGDTEFTPVKPKVTDPNEFKPARGPSSQAKVTPKDKQKEAADAQAAALAAQADARAKRIATSISGLSKTLGKDQMVQIGSSSDNSEASANYSDLVYSVYYAAWHPPASITDEHGLVTVRVTISRNGQVTRHEITKTSGNATLDRSIENTLNNVTVIAPFPDGSKDLERSYGITFDLSAKKSM